MNDPNSSFSAGPLELISAKVLHLDIGCGRGDFLIRAASSIPNGTFIGIDVNVETLRILQERLKSNEIRNAVVYLNEGREFLFDYVPPKSVTGIHVYFPTPYLKTLIDNDQVVVKPTELLITLDFLAHCKSTLVDGGSIRIVSDKVGIIRGAKELAAIAGLTEVPWSPLLEDNVSQRSVIGTGCELEMTRRGQKVFTLMLV